MIQRASKRTTHVDTDDGADHLGHNDHVTQVRLDHRRLLVGAGRLLRLSQLLDQTDGAALQTPLEPSARTSMDELGPLVLSSTKAVCHPPSRVTRRIDNCSVLPIRSAPAAS